MIPDVQEPDNFGTGIGLPSSVCLRGNDLGASRRVEYRKGHAQGIDNLAEC